MAAMPRTAGFPRGPRFVLRFCCRPADRRVAVLGAILPNFSGGQRTAHNLRSRDINGRRAAGGAHHLSAATGRQFQY